MCLTKFTDTPTMIVAAFAILTTTLAAPAVAADFTMRINHTFGINSFPDRALQEFKKEIEQKSDKRIEVRLYSSGELGQEIEQYELLQTGSLEAALLGGQILSSVTPEYAMFEAPYLWRDQEHLRKVWDGAVGKEVSEALLKRKGIQIIGVWNRGARNLTTNSKVVKSPRDLQGLKIRTTQNPVHVAAWKALGAIPTPMAFGEVFMGLRQGVIDGQENPLDLIQSASLFEVQKNLHLTQHVRSIGWLGVSEILVPPPARQPQDPGARPGEVGDAAQRHDARGRRGEDPRRAGEEDDDHSRERARSRRLPRPPQGPAGGILPDLEEGPV